MDNIHPANVEVFHLRLLLKHRRGSTSFQDLRTVDGIDMGSYRAAAVALNLCQNDQNYIDCMHDAVIHSMPSTLRQLYCSILTQGFPTDPRTILIEFRTEMMEDFIHQHRQNPAQYNEVMIDTLSYNDLLCDIRLRLDDMGMTLLDFGLDEPDNALSDLLSTTLDVDDSDSDQLFYENNRHKLTHDQDHIFCIISNHINESSAGLYAIDAPGGCGKTFLCNVLLAYARMNHKIAIAMALSGIAATLLKNGTTFHRRFGGPGRGRDIGQG